MADVPNIVECLREEEKEGGLQSFSEKEDVNPSWYKMAIEATDDMIAAVDANYVYLFANNSFLKKHKLTQKEVVGHSVAEVIGKDIFENNVKPKVDACLDGESIQYEMSYIFEDVGERYLLVNYFPLIRNDVIEGVVSVIKDITDRKKEKRALEKSEKRYRRLAETTSEGILLTDKLGRLSYVNPALEEMFGIPASKSKGVHFSRYMTKKSSLKAIKLFRKLKKGKSVKRFELTAIHKEKHRFPIEVSASPIEEEGDFIGLVAVISDISQRKQAKKALKKSEKKYQAIFENTGTATAIINKDTTFSLVNSKFAELSGYSKKELEEKRSWTEFISKDDLPQMKKYHDLRREDPDAAPHSYEFRFINREGDVRDVLGFIDMIPNSKKSIASLLDITDQKQKERKIKKSKKETEHILNAAAGGIRIIDADFNVKNMNQAMADMVNISIENGIGMKCSDMFCAKNICNTKECSLRKILENEEGFTRETTRINKDGDEIPCLDYVSPYYDENNNIVGIIEDHRDVSEIKNAEEKLRRSEEQYRKLVNNANDIITVVQDGKIKFANEKAFNTVGISKEELISQPFLKFVHPEDREIVKSRHIQRLNGEDAPNYYDFRLIDKNDNIVWVNISAVEIQWNGRPATLNFLTDVTEKKKMEEKIKQSERRFKTMFESAPDAYYLNDMKGIFIDANSAAEELIGYKKEELVGKKFNQMNILPKKYIPKAAKCLALNSMGKSTGPDEFELKRKNGNLVPVEIKTHPIKLDGKRIVLGIARDITERKEAERKLRESEKIKTEFMNVAAHELKTPLIPLKGYLELLESDEGLDKDKREWVEISLRNVEKLTALINDILDVSRLEANAMKLNFTKVDIRKIVKEVQSDMKPLIEKKDLELNVALPDELPEVKVDKKRISQVLRNLVDNGIKCTQEGTITIKAQPEKNKLIISVKDTGKGIPKKDLPKLFKKFSQLDSTAKREVDGTGLGLYICKGIIEQHGGMIWAESKGKGEGSTFTFTLPTK